MEWKYDVHVRPWIVHDHDLMNILVPTGVHTPSKNGIPDFAKFEGEGEVSVVHEVERVCPDVEEVKRSKVTKVYLKSL